MKVAKIIKKAIIYVVSGLGAAGSALQSYMALVDLLKGVASHSLVFMHGAAVGFGGICGGLINFFINVELLESFYQRLAGKKPMPNLDGAQAFQYWFGSAVFVVTGILFGLTVFAFAPVGILAAVSIVAGVFVAAIMVVQELETWLESFDDAEENKKSLKQKFDEWCASLTPSKVLGIAIAIGNVVALSLLFTLGLATFLIGVGVPALPALVGALVVGFTGGAFTEFYFYNRFLSDFCDKLAEKWNNFCASKYSPLGLVISTINACVFGASCYVGITMITGLLTAASIAIPPLGVVIAIAATASTFAAAASFVLALSFWQRNSNKLLSALPDFNGGSSTAVMGNRLAADLSVPILFQDSVELDDKKVFSNDATLSGFVAEQHDVVVSTKRVVGLGV